MCEAHFALRKVSSDHSVSRARPNFFKLSISNPKYRRANARVGGQHHAPPPVSESVIRCAEAQFQVRSAPKSWGEWGSVLSLRVESVEQAATGEDFGLLLHNAPHAQVLRWDSDGFYAGLKPSLTSWKPHHTSIPRVQGGCWPSAPSHWPSNKHRRPSPHL